MSDADHLKAKAVAVVELDAMGQLWDRCSLDSADRKPCQLRNAIAYIESERRLAQSAGEDPIVITYVHGWRHNAESKDDDFKSFSRILFQLEKDANDAFVLCHNQRNTANCPQKRNRFIGAYVAWRGQVVRTPLDYFTVFDREGGARRTAAVSITEVLVRLRNAAKQTSADDKTLPDESARFLLFGHSYGGLIVARVMAQMLTASLLPEHKIDSTPCEGKPGVSPFADLVVLINPAMDSIETVQLIDLMKRSQAKVCYPIKLAPGLSAPLIIAIHSRTDVWTGNAFAAGHTLESVNKAFRSSEGKNTPPGEKCDFCDTGVGKPPSEGFLFRNTPGYAIYLANLCYIDDTNTGDWVCESVRDSVKEAKIQANVDIHTSAYGMVIADPTHQTEPVTKLSGFVAIQKPFPSNPNSVINNLYYRTSTKPDSYGHSKPWNDTPYWIFTVPDSIVHQHGGFWAPAFTNLMSDLVIATTPPNGTPITIH